MKYRLNKFHAQSSYTADTTVVIDLNISDVISSIVLGLAVTNSSATMTANPVACITDLQLVDGSDVLYSLDGYEAEAIDWYNNGGKFRSNYNIALTGNSIERYIGINFGRFLYDPLYALDPTRFNNLQLRITLDIDAGGNAGSANKITAWANLFNERPTDLKGFFTSKEVKQYTMASATHEYTDLAVDHVYRGLYFRPFLLGTEPNQAVSNIKLSVDQDKEIPFDAGAQDILRVIQASFPPVVESYFFNVGTSTKYIYCAPSTRVTAQGSIWAAATADRTFAFYNGDGGRLDAIVNTGSQNAQVHITGWVPHCVYQIPFGNSADPGDWFNPAGIRSLRLDITGGAAAQGFLFNQQVRNY